MKINNIEGEVVKDNDMDGQGKMQLDDKTVLVKEGEVILIEDGVFHRVHNTGDKPLYMVCVFNGNRNH